MALDEETKANLEVLKALNKAIEEGPWEHNLFFQGIGKKLRDLRDRFQDELGLHEHLEQNNPVQPGAIQGTTSQNQLIDVYVSLYQAEGANLQKWGVVVNSLVGHSLTRPVYKNEEDIKELIRSKDYKNNDAYVAVRIRLEDIYPPIPDKPLVDRLGHELLVLRDNVIKLENILYFVHVSGRYLLHNRTLIRENTLQ